MHVWSQGIAHSCLWVVTAIGTVPASYVLSRMAPEILVTSLCGQHKLSLCGQAANVLPLIESRGVGRCGGDPDSALLPVFLMVGAYPAPDTFPGSIHLIVTRQAANVSRVGLLALLSY
jgi:hypothetical protein